MHVFMTEMHHHDSENSTCDPLTYISLASFLLDIGNSADPDQTPRFAASDQGIHCLLTMYPIEI